LPSSTPPWMKVWPEGLPRSLEYPGTLAYHDLLEKARASPTSTALIQVEDGSRYSYEELARKSMAVAGWLQEKGVTEGDQVLFAAFNTKESVAGLFGIWMSGAQAVLVDPLTTSEDLLFQLSGRGIRIGLISLEFLVREQTVLSDSGLQEALVLDSYSQKAKAGIGVSSLGEVEGFHMHWREPNIRSDDVALVMYYAGIAGRTMQTYHTHFAVNSSTLALISMMKTEIQGGLVVAPITHILGLQAGLLVSLFTGGTAVMMKKWDPDLALVSIRDYGVNYVPGAPMMHDSLLRRAREQGASVHLDLGISGGAPLSPETQEGYRSVFGAPLVQIYGMTEAWIVTFQPTSIAEVKGTVGIPLPDVDVKIVEPDRPSEEKGIGEVGELLVRSPWLMKGYEDEEETNRVFIDGWLRTGDLMVMDERGLLYFRGVRKRMLKYKAYPIFPRDLELILERHPLVDKALVIGEPHPEYGTLPVARVKLRPGAEGRVTPEELMEYVNSKVAFYKKIRRVEIVEEL